MKIFLNKYVALLLLFITTIVSAQLPKGLTETEKQIISDYQFAKYTMTHPQVFLLGQLQSGRK